MTVKKLKLNADEIKFLFKLNPELAQEVVFSRRIHIPLTAKEKRERARAYFKNHYHNCLKKDPIKYKKRLAKECKRNRDKLLNLKKHPLKYKHYLKKRNEYCRKRYAKSPEVRLKTKLRGIIYQERKKSKV